jgi:hypothetical protein
MDGILPMTIPASMMKELKQHSEKFFSNHEEYKEYVAQQSS